MNFSLYIAKRYLFSKKSHNAINIISAISALGVTVGTIALVCVLSVFNGFGSLIEGLFSAFDPDLKISLVEGKSFMANDEALQKVKHMPEVVYFTEVLEENALFRYKDKQVSGTVKGVSDDFAQMTGIDKIIVSGKFQLYDKAFNYGITGAGLSAKLGVGPYFVDPVYIYAPQRTSSINLTRPETNFVLDHVFVSGVFGVQQADYDNKYLLVPIQLARSLFQYEAHTVTAIELKIADKKAIKKSKDKIKSVLGAKYKVFDRYEQQEDFFRIMKIEKWITYLILSFILLIAVFNIIGSLSMLIIDKKADIVTLRNMGADQGLVRKIFLLEGWMISLLGSFVGIFVGTGLCLLQQYFGLITLPGSEFIVQAYPVEIQWLDLVLIFITVSVMGFIAAYYPVKQIKTETFEV